ncbi:hypothetical protein [Leifsonia sp. Leaf264]|uniref:hypothetical protein n=1 Tax=Leifsonia sp. Leaf264 TaxID=1736314 RepID=UPI0006FC63C0|nr:hypothetical protein [Leifsonia sp. Leaf264]KQO98440.1 hypothetical protein ASF30_10285 [Leifsonia sp. Leaf264]
MTPAAEIAELDDTAFDRHQLQLAAELLASAEAKLHAIRQELAGGADLEVVAAILDEDDTPDTRSADVIDSVAAEAFGFQFMKELSDELDPWFVVENGNSRYLWMEEANFALVATTVVQNYLFELADDIRGATTDLSDDDVVDHEEDV